MPCLNEERNIGLFLNSLAQQSWKNFELIVVDGGSTDISREIVDYYVEAFDHSCTKLINTKRNLGFIRNLGARAARGEILLFTNSDAILSRWFLNNVAFYFAVDQIQALSGRTIPVGGGALCFAGYHCFDLLRLFFSKLGRFSPSGNFLAIKKDLFWKLGGFPEVKVNEDGELGSRISRARAAVKFIWSLKTWHHAKRFRKGVLKTLLFYSYVFGNFSPMLKKLLSHIERKSSREFDQK